MASPQSKERLLQQIKDTETDVKNIISEGEKTKKKLIDEAERAARRIVADAEHAAKLEYEKGLKEALAAISMNKENILSVARANAEKLRAHAEQKMDVAIATVIKRLETTLQNA